jgi:hypothetical protein
MAMAAPIRQRCERLLSLSLPLSLCISLLSSLPFALSLSLVCAGRRAAGGPPPWAFQRSSCSTPRGAPHAHELPRRGMREQQLPFSPHVTSSTKARATPPPGLPALSLSLCFTPPLRVSLSPSPSASSTTPRLLAADRLVENLQYSLDDFFAESSPTGRRSGLQAHRPRKQTAAARRAAGQPLCPSAPGSPLPKAHSAATPYPQPLFPESASPAQATPSGQGAPDATTADPHARKPSLPEAQARNARVDSPHKASQLAASPGMNAEATQGPHTLLARAHPRHGGHAGRGPTL